MLDPWVHPVFWIFNCFWNICDQVLDRICLEISATNWRQLYHKFSLNFKRFSGKYIFILDGRQRRWTYKCHNGNEWVWLDPTLLQKKGNSKSKVHICRCDDIYLFKHYTFVTFRLVPVLATMSITMAFFYFARKCYQKFKNRSKATNILPLVQSNQEQSNQQFNIQAYNPEVFPLKMGIFFIVMVLFVLFSLFFIVPKIEHKNAIFPLLPPFMHSILFPIAMFCFNSKFRKFVFEMMCSII